MLKKIVQLFKDSNVKFGYHTYEDKVERVYLEPLKAELPKYKEDEGYKKRFRALCELGDVLMSDFDCFRDRTAEDKNEKELKEVQDSLAESQYIMRRTALLMEKVDTYW
jgi:hypothetical protein